MRGGKLGDGVENLWRTDGAGEYGEQLASLPSIRHGSHATFGRSSPIGSLGGQAGRSAASRWANGARASRSPKPTPTSTRRRAAAPAIVMQLSTQAIIDRFALDKSAASRHLRQLVATDLIEEKREEGAKKVYQLNGRAVDEIMRMLNGLR